MSIIIGLTGPTGSGKSSASKTAAGFGLQVIDCDITAREAVKKGSPGLNALSAAFGGEILLPDGSLDLESCQGRMLNPGHVLEAMWFLLNALARRGGDPDKERQICEIISSTLEFGWDRSHGGINR